MKRGTENKAKFAKLKRLLGLATWEIRGLIDSIWWLTEHNCPAGNIGKLTDEDIAIAIEWTRTTPEELVEALQKSGWIEKSDEFRLIVHDWSEHCEDHIHSQLARSGTKFADGKIPKMTRLSAAERLVAEKRFAITQTTVERYDDNAEKRRKTPKNAEKRRNDTDSVFQHRQTPKNAEIPLPWPLPFLDLNSVCELEDPCSEPTGEREENTHTHTELKNGIEEIAHAIAEVCKIDAKLSELQITPIAISLSQTGYTAKDVLLCPTVKPRFWSDDIRPGQVVELVGKVKLAQKKAERTAKANAKSNDLLKKSGQNANAVKLAEDGRIDKVRKDWELLPKAAQETMVTKYSSPVVKREMSVRLAMLDLHESLYGAPGSTIAQKNEESHSEAAIVR